MTEQASERVCDHFWNYISPAHVRGFVGVCQWCGDVDPDSIREIQAHALRDAAYDLVMLPTPEGFESWDEAYHWLLERADNIMKETRLGDWDGW